MRYSMTLSNLKLSYLLTLCNLYLLEAYQAYHISYDIIRNDLLIYTLNCNTQYNCCKAKDILKIQYLD